MTIRRVLFAIGSVLLSIISVVLLIRLGKIDVGSSVRQLRSTPFLMFFKLVVFNLLLVLISTEKWRSVDARFRNPADAVPPWSVSYFVTSLGLALGLLLPVQLGMTGARTLGTNLYGKALLRGAAATLVEQSFDIFLLLFIALATTATLIWRAGGFMWSVFALAAILFSALLASPSMRLLGAITKTIAGRISAHNFFGAKLRTLSATFEESLALSPLLGQRLLILSVLRFGVVVAMTRETAAAIGAPIPLWQLAAIVPFAVVVMLLAVTPGGIGVSELTSVGVLRLLGTPLEVSAPWAVANRILATASCVLVSALAGLIVVADRGLLRHLNWRSESARKG